MLGLKLDQVNKRVHWLLYLKPEDRFNTITVFSGIKILNIKTVARPSYGHKGIRCTDKTSPYWDGPNAFVIKHKSKKTYILLNGDIYFHERK